MQTGIIIGNIISAVAAVFTIISSLSHGKKKIYGFQALQCLAMALSSVFFGSWSAITTFVLCAARNGFAAYDRLTVKICVIITVLTAVMGLYSNNRGLIGLIPIVATVIYSVGMLLLKSELTIKLNIVLNLILWAIYDFFVLDFVSGTVDSLSGVVTAYAVIALLVKENKDGKSADSAGK